MLACAMGKYYAWLRKKTDVFVHVHVHEHVHALWPRESDEPCDRTGSPCWNATIELLRSSLVHWMSEVEKSICSYTLSLLSLVILGQRVEMCVFRIISYHPVLHGVWMRGFQFALGFAIRMYWSFPHQREWEREGEIFLCSVSVVI